MQEQPNDLQRTAILLYGGAVFREATNPAVDCSREIAEARGRALRFGASHEELWDAEMAARERAWAQRVDRLTVIK